MNLTLKVHKIQMLKHDSKQWENEERTRRKTEELVNFAIDQGIGLPRDFLIDKTLKALFGVS